MTHRATNSTTLPASIYRLQLHKGFNLKQATAILPYLKSLGVEGVYCSPYFKAYSKHGYDVIDSTMINPDIGTWNDFEAFCEKLQLLDMQHFIDIVPNHMGIRGGNGWWEDVLEHGPYARSSCFFDINWDVEKEAMKGKVYLPILGDTYGNCLERQEIKLRYENGRLFFQVYDFKLPLAVSTYHSVLNQKALHKRIHSLSKLPKTPAKRAAITERVKKELISEISSNSALEKSVQKRINDLNRSTDALHQLLEAQYYRLCCHRVSNQEINYRRFFNFNDLAAVAIDNGHVLNAHHRLVFELASKKMIQGIRIDHPDGLLDPLQYFERMKEKTKLPLFLEKILDPHEKLPDHWPVEGTVGYEYLNKLNALFIQKGSEKSFSHIYHTFIGKDVDFGDLLYEKKRFFANTYMRNEIEYLGQLLDHVSDLDYRYRDFTRNDLTSAILEVIADFPVYRTYIDHKMKVPSRIDQIYIQEAFGRVHKRHPLFPKDVLHFLEDVLLLKLKIKPEHHDHVRNFIYRFQQFSSPIMARGLEDICFYVYNRFVSLNEVGGDPRSFGITTGAFHQFNGEKHHKWPYGILTTSTHDTKRSEDVRMRLNALSEMPELWKEKVFEWGELNRKWKRRDFPDPNTEYLIYQMLIGLWPEKKMATKEWRVFKGRLWGNLLKSIREMRERTNWDVPNEKYEDGVKHFLFNILDRQKNRSFISSLEPFVKTVTKLGYLYSLSATVIKLGSPGIVDIYQGNEDWKFVWVDPDNRGDVDYTTLKRKLSQIISGKQSKRPHLKQAIYWKGLHFRRKHPDLFLTGDYIPLTVKGPEEDRVIAFMRKSKKKVAIILAARFLAESVNWQGTYVEVPVTGRFADLFSERSLTIKQKKLPLEKVFQTAHYALLY